MKNLQKGFKTFQNLSFRLDEITQYPGDLRDHAGPGIKVGRVDPNTQSMLLEVQTDGWPIKEPLEQGRVTFNLRRYGANGRQDEENGDWKVDVIGAE